MIDLIGYRFGHNETDEPAYTQPLMAAKIKEHPPVSQLYAEALVKEGIVTPDEVEERNKERQAGLKRRPRGTAAQDRSRATTRTPPRPGRGARSSRARASRPRFRRTGFGA